MKRVFCKWRHHCASHLAMHVGAPNLAEEPVLNVQVEPWMQPGAFCRAHDETTLFINWAHQDRLEIKVLIKGKEVIFSGAAIETAQDGVFIGGLPRHVDVLLTCGRLFASVEWHWTLNQYPKVSLTLHGEPVLAESRRIVFEPPGSERRLRQLVEACANGSSDWLGERPNIAIGAARALLLRRLGASLDVTPDLLDLLSVGKFEDHFSSYWIQMLSMRRYLTQKDDWQWAAKHLVPPRSAAQNESN